MAPPWSTPRTCDVPVKFDMCKSKMISVEAELGAVSGSESGSRESSANTDRYTDIGQAIDFVGKTKIDALAVAIGNAHGKYKEEPKLDFERLEGLNQALQAAILTTSTSVTSCGEKYSDYLDVLESVKASVAAVVLERMTVFQNRKF